MIKSVLEKTWPGLRIVGEEADVCYDATHNHFDDMPKSKEESRLYQKTHLRNAFDVELPIEHCCAWVDPLDATTSFTKGRLTEVSSLVGLSYKNRAKIGILGVPYTITNENFHPNVMIGDANHPVVYVLD